jgi:hypothetical protein
MQTKAEVRARKFAARFEEAGFTTEVRVEEHPAELYSNGGTMLPARTSVSVFVNPPTVYDDSYSFSFITWHRSGRHRESTVFSGGHVYRRFRSRRRKFSKKLSLRELGIALACELEHARYRARKSQGV